jgi:hypothetical protein
LRVLTVIVATPGQRDGDALGSRQTGMEGLTVFSVNHDIRSPIIDFELREGRGTCVIFRGDRGGPESGPSHSRSLDTKSDVLLAIPEDLILCEKNILLWAENHLALKTLIDGQSGRLLTLLFLLWVQRRDDVSPIEKGVAAWREYINFLPETVGLPTEWQTPAAGTSLKVST